MAMAPFGTRPVPPATPAGESRRARLAVLIATLGIAATLLAYAVSPGVRHAVSHAAHSVKHAVSRVLDHDTGKRKPAKQPAAPLPARRSEQRGARPSSSAPSVSGGFTVSTPSAAH
jgi:hypothetical protein